MRIELDVPETVLTELLDCVEIPRFASVEYRQETPPGIGDVAGAVRAAVQDVVEDLPLAPGTSVAVAVGSRGIGGLRDIVAALVASLREKGAEPFIVPAMGSHGGATAEGQRDVLAHLDITEGTVGAPILSCMDTVVVGQTPDGTPVRVDRLAMEADAIVPVARVKPHTAFQGRYESGMAKMLAIGLGKQAGAALTHRHGFGEMARMVPEMARVVLARAPVNFSLAVLENARDEPFLIRAVAAEHILEAEPALLEQARAAMPRLPFESLDVLVIDKIGKNISGDGADPNVTGRFPTPFAVGGPSIDKQVVLDLTRQSDGNANGLGTADFTTVRAVRKVQLGKTYPNALTSTVPGPVKIPMILPSDRLALQAALLTCHAVGRPPRVVRIADTLHLGEMWVSEALEREVEALDSTRIAGRPAEPLFDEHGNFRERITEPFV